MFNDIKNLELIIGDDEFANKYILENNITNILYVGFNLNNIDNLELQFYNMAKLPVQYKYDFFHINRNINREISIFEDLKLQKNNYIFLHKGDYELRNDTFPTNIKIVEPKEYGLFDWMYVIENAKEIHCIDSSFLCLIDCMSLRDDIKLVNHRYVRNYPDWIKLWTNKKWIEIR
jgi:predicted transcriptional regulator